MLGPMSDMLQSTAQHYHSLMEPVVNTAAGIEHIDAVVSSTVTTSNAAAASQEGFNLFGLFGHVDPYLKANKPIAPPDKALLDMGITPTFHAKSASSILPADVSPVLKGSVQNVMDNKWPVLDSSKLANGGASHLPGFEDIHGILPSHNRDLLRAQDDPDTLKYQVAWASQFLKSFDKLPYAAFWYAMLEFFILRPGIDLYKEDIEDDPAGVVAETVVVGGVRVAAFILIGIVTMSLFG